MDPQLQVQYKTTVARIALPASIKHLETAAAVIFGLKSPWLFLQTERHLEPLCAANFQQLQINQRAKVVAFSGETESATIQAHRNRFLNSSTDVCPVCYEKFIHPLVSKCGHICCEQCWTSLLASKLECPICRARTRVKMLREV